MDIYEKMQELGIELPPPPPKGGVYAPVKEFGQNLVYVSGCGPSIEEPVTGKLGDQFTVEQGQQHARACMLNLLSVLQSGIGDLCRVKSCVKILVLVAGTNEFYSQPAVANGASGLLVDVFGEAVGTPSRSAIGVNALPGNIPVEVEGIFEIEPE